jgi:FlaA1/EpsC-like NDP-sugar epimerase
MEANPVEAVRNNAIATRVVAHVAGELGVTRFVLVSTDKAVAPATVMGASKALAEFALEAAGARFPGTRYAAVRFGNVLGSSGSVVPIFRRQIERGGPVTVTDERMTRYFMTIPEAVQLIIRSGSLACKDATPPRAQAHLDGRTRIVRASPSVGSEVFVLDMGEPVRILELARAMIELSGLDPERDVDIEIVGRRNGEKLDEELFNSYERPLHTSVEKILLADREPLAAEAVEAMFAEIGLLVLEGDAAGLAAKVSELSAVRFDPQTERIGERGRGRLPLPTAGDGDLRFDGADGHDRARAPLSREARDNDRGELLDNDRGELPDGDRGELRDGDGEELPNRRRALREDPRTPPAPLLHSRDP